MLSPRKRGSTLVRWAVIPFVFLIDRGFKIWAVSRLNEGEGIPVWKGVFHLTRVNNTGSAFGMWRDWPWLPVAVTAVAVLGIFVHLARGRDAGNFFGWSLVLGGALGNLYDRIRFGYVLDFLDFRVWPVFNVADACICLGVFLIFWSSFLKHAPHSV